MAAARRRSRDTARTPRRRPAPAPRPCGPSAGRSSRRRRASAGSCLHLQGVEHLDDVRLARLDARMLLEVEPQRGAHGLRARRLVPPVADLHARRAVHLHQPARALHHTPGPGAPGGVAVEPMPGLPMLVPLLIGGSGGAAVPCSSNTHETPSGSRRRIFFASPGTTAVSAPTTSTGSSGWPATVTPVIRSVSAPDARKFVTPYSAPSARNIPSRR